MRFTAENAAEMARCSHAPGSRRFTAPEPPPPDPQPPQSAPQPAEAYPDLRLARVRKQLDRIDDLMLSETDPQKLDRLAAAQPEASSIKLSIVSPGVSGSAGQVPEAPQNAQTAVSQAVPATS